MGSRLVALAIGLASIAVQPLAGQEKPKTSSFAVDLGFVSAAGNTSVTTFNFGDKVVLNSADKRVIFTQTFAVVRSEADGVKNAENYRAQLRLDYGLRPRVFLFGLTGWERNVPAGVARRFEETVGLAVKAIASPRNQLGLELGLSLFQQRNTDSVGGQKLRDDYKAGRVAAMFKHRFSESTFFDQLLELIPNFDDADDFRLNSESALVAPLSTNLAIKLGYVIRFDNLPSFLPQPNPTLDRFKKTDRFLTAGLTISF